MISNKNHQFPARIVATDFVKTLAESNLKSLFGEAQYQELVFERLNIYGSKIIFAIPLTPCPTTVLARYSRFRGFKSTPRISDSWLVAFFLVFQVLPFHTTFRNETVRPFFKAE